MLALYRAFEIGKLVLVGPVSAPAILLSRLFSRCFLVNGCRCFASLGIVAALGGVTPGSGGGKVHRRMRIAWSKLRSDRGPRLGHRVRVRLRSRCSGCWEFASFRARGALATVWLIRITGAIITFAVVLAKKIPLRVKNRATNAQLYTMGFLRYRSICAKQSRHAHGTSRDQSAFLARFTVR